MRLSCILDRLLHHSHIVSIKGPSYRIQSKLQYLDTEAKAIEMICQLPLEEEQVVKEMAKSLRDDARRQLKEAEYDNFENCAYALDPCIGGSFDMFLNEPKNSYVRMRLRELLRMHIYEIKPGRNHVFELKVEV